LFLFSQKTMAAHKKSHIRIFFVSVMIILSLFSGFGEGQTYINYNGMKGDIIPGCSSKNPKECVKIPAYSYNRGCEISTRCQRQQHSSSS